MIEITIATIGRLTKKRAMVYFASPAGPGRCRLARRWPAPASADDGHAVLDPLEPFDDDLFARLEPVLDDPERVDPRADLHVAKRDFVLVVDHRDAVQVLQFLHGALRHEERAALGVEQHARAPVLARPQELMRDWET